ncbi:MAG: cereblon family protein [Candidatus Competibacteraceae bacterium]
MQYPANQRHAGSTKRFPSLWCFDKQAVDPALRAAIATVAAEKEDEPQHTLNCRHCGHPITRPDTRIQVNERHSHVFTNPHGITYRIGCFGAAPGVARRGELTDFWSWFPGYRWQIALCGACQLHLGWRFVADHDQFFGLILNRLVESKDAARL